MPNHIGAYKRMINVTSVFRFSDGFLSLTYARCPPYVADIQRIRLPVVFYREWFRQLGFCIARSTLRSPLRMLLHISIRYRWSVLNSFGSTLDSCSASWTGSNEETGCSLHVTSRFPIDPENPCWHVVAPLSDWNRLRKGSSLAWSRHTSTCRGRSKTSSSRQITSAVCPVFTFVPSHPTKFMFSVLPLSYRIPLFETSD